MTLDWINLITYAGLAFGTIVSFHFFTAKRPGIAIRLLGLYTLLLSLSLTEFIVGEKSAALVILGSFLLLYGPVLFLYVKSRLNRSTQFRVHEVMHIIPFALYFVLLMLSHEKSSSTTADDQVVELVVYELVFFQIFLYGLFAMRAVRKHRIMMTAEPEVDRMQLAFIKTLVLVSMLLFGTSYIGTHVFIFSGAEIPSTFKFSIQIGLCVVLFAIALLNTETMYKERMVKAY